MSACNKGDRRDAGSAGAAAVPAHEDRVAPPDVEERRRQRIPGGTGTTGAGAESRQPVSRNAIATKSGSARRLML